jgi:RinA family phage transcriptional activator
LDDIGARKLIASILKQAHEDYTKDNTCPAWCEFKDECGEKTKDNDRCDAKKFIHAAWCATLCEGINIDPEDYIKACIEKYRLSKNTYRYIENEIRHYKNTEKELKRLKDDLINESSVAPEIRGSEVSSPTENKVIKLSLNKKITEMEKTIKAIEKVHRTLTRNKKSVMEEYWIGRYTTQGLAGKLGVDERTIRRWKKHIVYSVAIELKYL